MLVRTGWKVASNFVRQGSVFGRRAKQVFGSP